MTMKVSIGSKLRMARIKKGLKQVEVCKLLNMPNSTLSNYERDVREPDLSTIVLFSELYEVSVDYFFNKGEVHKLWNRLLHSTEPPTDDSYRALTDFEFEFIRDARKMDFNFLKWQYLTEEQKDLMFRIVQSTISELYNEKKNTN